VFEGVEIDYKLFYDFEIMERAIEELNLVGSSPSLVPSISGSVQTLPQV
jgi:hypothetical protein